MRYSWRRIAGLPAVRMLVLFSIGIVVQWHVALPGTLLLRLSAAALIACTVLTVAAFRRRSLSPARDAALLPLLVLCGMLRTADMLEQQPESLLRFADRREKLTVTGVIADEPRIGHDRQRFRLACSSVRSDSGEYRVSGTVMLSWHRSRFDARDTLRPLRRGDRLQLRCRLRVPLPPRQSGAFDGRSWLIGEHCILQGSVSKGGDLAIIGHRSPGWMAEAVHAVRGGARAALRTHYSPTQAAVLTGLLLGDRGLIDDEVMEDFRRSGIMHILAVSGLHAGIILLLVFIPTERLPYLLRAVLAVAGLWSFAAVTGFAPPVTRAATMGSLTLGAVVLQRQSNTVNALAAAGLIILAVDPLELTGLSFQLSFTAVLGILMFHRRVQESLTGMLPRRIARHGITKTLASLLALTISAQALSLPLLLHAFGEVSPAGLLTNLLAVPLVFIVVTCGVLSILVHPLSSFLAGSFAASGGLCLDGILWLSDTLAALPGASVQVPVLPIPMLIAYVVCIMYATHTHGRLRQKLVLLTLVTAAVLVLTTALQPGNAALLRVTFLDVGQGDAAVIELPGGGALLVDAGPGGASSDAGTRSVLPFLRQRGITRLDAMVITHPDDDHRGGAGSVLDAIPVHAVMIGGTWPDHGAAAALYQQMQQRAGVVRDVRSGDRFVFGPDIRMYVLSPPQGENIEACNEHSVVFLLVYGETRFLFTGDADAAAERRMLACYDTLLQADVLKVGHHGSTTSTSPAFALKVRPTHAVISVGRNNQFNHPREEILSRLRLLGAQISRTDVEGSVGFVSDGKRVEKLLQSR